MFLRFWSFKARLGAILPPPKASSKEVRPLVKVGLMGRANRLTVEGGIFHVTHRCHNQVLLLKFARDRDAYREKLREALADFGGRDHGAPKSLSLVGSGAVELATRKRVGGRGASTGRNGIGGEDRPGRSEEAGILDGGSGSRKPGVLGEAPPINPEPSGN